jgi:hypothetical protein
MPRNPPTDISNAPRSFLFFGGLPSSAQSTLCDPRLPGKRVWFRTRGIADAAKETAIACSSRRTFGARKRRVRPALLAR